MKKVLNKKITRYGYTSGPNDLKMEERFWEKVQKSEHGCWEWKSARGGPMQYGVMSFGGNARNAHRISWMINKGPIPEGKFVLHKCDNPTCVNPDHLFLGGYLENNRDMTQKKRHGTQLFTREQKTRIAAIYDKYNAKEKGGLTAQRIADFFGLKKSYIYQFTSKKARPRLCAALPIIVH
tara:strand:+ start:277 stop:816 length:540 start_codon:yes stop_codon:yes gene_type:complete